MKAIRLPTPIVSAICGLALAPFSADAAQQARCPFDTAALTFDGSLSEQARCLLRPVRPFGHLGPTLEALPAPLSNLVGQSVTVAKADLRSFLLAHHVAEAELGGSLDAPLSRANDNAPDGQPALYFVIHDTSTPNFHDAPFPADVDQPEWAFNSFSRYGAVAHVFVNRAGVSLAKHDLGTPFRATKFENKVVGQPAKGRFVHVELIQPRRRHPAGGAANDALAPDPGFTVAQLDRLALVYVAASVRAGRWLIPAYHAALDAGLADAHDDPQRFELESWAARLEALLGAIAARHSGTCDAPDPLAAHESD